MATSLLPDAAGFGVVSERKQDQEGAAASTPPPSNRDPGRVPPPTPQVVRVPAELMKNAVLWPLGLEWNEGENDLEIGQKFGSGSYADVYAVQFRNKSFALKFLHEPVKSQKVEARQMQEVLLIASIPRHPHILETKRAWRREGRVALLMEKADYVLSYTDRLDLCLRHVASALAHLHSYSIAHLDVRPDNILVMDPGRTFRPSTDSDPIFKLADFGCAVSWKETKSWDGQEGDGRYLAPEVLASPPVLSGAADIYSLGVTLIHMILKSAHLPFSTVAAALPILCKLDPAPSLLAIILKMIHADPTQRPTAQALSE